MFKDLTKVQINSERNVTLAIRINDNHVHNLVFTIQTFTHIMRKDINSWYGPIHSRNWYLQKFSDRVKLFSESYEYIYRFTLEEWNTVVHQYVAALKLHYDK